MSLPVTSAEIFSISLVFKSSILISGFRKKDKEKLFAMQLGSIIKKENINDWNNTVNKVILHKNEEIQRKNEEEFEIKWKHHIFYQEKTYRMENPRRFHRSRVRRPWTH